MTNTRRDTSKILRRQGVGEMGATAARHEGGMSSTEILNEGSADLDATAVVKLDGMSSKDAKDYRKRKALEHVEALRKGLLELPTPCEACERVGRTASEWVFERCFAEGHLMATQDQRPPPACQDCLEACVKEGACGPPAMLFTCFAQAYLA